MMNDDQPWEHFYLSVQYSLGIFLQTESIQKLLLKA